jgi:hypothetical protein
MKRSDALRDLSDDHHTALVLALHARRAAASGDPDAIASAWAAIDRDFPQRLEPHFAIEERWLAPPLAATGETALPARMQDDHAALRTLAAAGEDRSADALGRFADRLATHVRFEERKLFPAAERRLSPAALAAIATACQKHRSGESSASAGPVPE